MRRRSGRPAKEREKKKIAVMGFQVSGYFSSSSSFSFFHLSSFIFRLGRRDACDVIYAIDCSPSPPTVSQAQLSFFSLSLGWRTTKGSQ